MVRYGGEVVVCVAEVGIAELLFGLREGNSAVFRETSSICCEIGGSDIGCLLEWATVFLS